VAQLLDVSRIEGGKLVLECVITDLTSLVQGAALAAQDSTDRHTLVVQARSKVSALVDPLRLEQVLTNLLDNAIKYSPQGGPIEVELVQPSPGRVRLSVRDRGIGIPPEMREQIFNRFYQAHSDAHISGIGLGLYISRQIVELHGGELRAEFPDDGGTCFIVDLPTAAGEVMTSHAVETPA
jgi:signal transduction histidine kinase